MPRREIKGVDDRFFLSNRGVEKRWIYENKLNHNLMYTYIQKLNYDYEDFLEYKDMANICGRKDVYYMVQVAVWIIETCDSLEKLIRNEVIKDFIFEEIEIKKARWYLKALRSMLIAHPLCTTRHPRYGFDGNFIAIDVGCPNKQSIFKIVNYRSVRIDMNGVCEDKSISDCDFCITGYRKNKGAEFYEFIGFMKQDIDNCVELYRRRIHKLDKYLRNIKKKKYLIG